MSDLWRTMPERFAGLLPDHAITMPNHFHGIIAIADPTPEQLAVNLRRPDVPSVVQAFKSLSNLEAKRQNLLEMDRLWQSHYYDHIVRNDKALEIIRQYIDDNPQQWSMDRENPAKTGLNPFYGWLEEEAKLWQIEHSLRK